mgnify:FL=1
MTDIMAFWPVIVPPDWARAKPTYIIRHVAPNSRWVTFFSLDVPFHPWRRDAALANRFRNGAGVGHVFLEACFGDKRQDLLGETQLWRIDGTGAHQLVYFKRAR